MSGKKALRQLLEENDKCFLMPCVYDYASNQVVEICGSPTSLLSGGEVSISLNDAIDYGFTSLIDLEWMISRASQTSSIPLIADIEDGFEGPLTVYRSAKHLSATGIVAIQLEDAGDIEDTCKILPKEKYLAKVKATVEALKGTDCLSIVRSNAGPYDLEQMREGYERLRITMEMGADMVTMALITTFDKAKGVAELVPGWEIFTNVRADNGVSAMTMDDSTPLGLRMCSIHYTMKAAIEGMLKRGLANFRGQNMVYTLTHASGTGQPDFNASSPSAPQDYLELENPFTGGDKEYTTMGHKVAPYPDELRKTDIKGRL